MLSADLFTLAAFRQSNYSQSALFAARFKRSMVERGRAGQI